MCSEPNAAFYHGPGIPRRYSFPSSGKVTDDFIIFTLALYREVESEMPSTH